MKKYGLIVLAIVLLSFNIAAYRGEDSSYTKYECIDMQNIEVNLNEDGELASNLKSSEKEKYYLKQKKKLEQVINENTQVKNYIKSLLKKGKTFKAISYSECYFEEVYESGEVSSRIVKESEIKKEKSVNPGIKKKRGRLTLVSSLITDKEIVGENAYAFSSIALWNEPAFYTGENRIRKEYISLSWPNTYESNGVNVAKGQYYGGKELNLKKEQEKKDSGILWSVLKGQSPRELEIDNVTVATQIVPIGEKMEKKLFMSEYIHMCNEKGMVNLKDSKEKKCGGVEMLNNGEGWKISSPIHIKII